MLILIRNMRDLRFRELMQVYSQTNRKTGLEEWPNLPADFAREMAEQSFYQYLKEVFFPTANAFYAIWEEQGHYVSALRMEPYRDGLLLEGLETVPEYRRNGYGLRLIRETLKHLSGQGETIIYSHVHKKNLPSRALHEKCGFQIISDYASYIDGSVNYRALTYICRK